MKPRLSIRQQCTWVALCAALLASVSSFAADTAPGGGRDREAMRAKHQEMKKEREAHREQRLQKLHDKLKLRPDQESAWGSFAAALKPPAHPDPQTMHQEMAKLTTPERIDKMQAMHKERQAHFDTMATATKQFYGQLDAEQKKIFDKHMPPAGGHGGPGRHRGPGGHGHEDMSPPAK